VSGKVTRTLVSSPVKSNTPPMLGPSSWPPKKVTDRGITVPFMSRPERDHRQAPESSDVGEPIAKCKSNVRIDELSLMRACAASLSPSRTPRTDWIVNPERSS
jgi:hypothetical protein